MAALTAPAPAGTARRGRGRAAAAEHRPRRPAPAALAAVLAAAASSAAWPAGCFCGGPGAGAPRLAPVRPSAITTLSVWSMNRPSFLSVEDVKMKKGEPIYRKRRGRRWRWHEPNKTWVELFKYEYLPEPDRSNSTELVVQLYRMRQMHLMLKFIPMAMNSPVFGSQHVIAIVRKMRLLKGTLGGRLQDRGQKEELRSTHVKLLEEFASRGASLLQASPPEGASADLIFETIFNIAELKELVPQFIPLVSALSVHARNGVDDVDGRKVARVIYAIAELRHEVPELKDTLLPALILHKSWQRWKMFWLQSGSAGVAPEHSRVMNALNKMKNEVPYLRSVLET